MKQNLQIAVSFDETYIDQFLTVVNNIYTLHKQYTNPSRCSNDLLNITDTLEFFVCYDGNLSNLPAIQSYITSIFPTIIFNYKHVPTECKEIYKFLVENYPFSRSRNTLQTCSVYYRLFLDTIWPTLDGLVLQIDLDLVFKQPVKSLFQLVYDMSKTTKHSLYACEWPAIQCWDFKLSTLGPNEQQEWIPIRGKTILQYYVDKWFKWFIECSRTLNTPINYLDYCTDLSTKNAIHFNAGVLMFDLTEYRRNNIQQICKDCVVIQKKFHTFFHNDQGLLNFVFFNKVGIIPKSWNLTDYGCGYYYLLHPTPEIQKEFKEANIIHFNGQYKPWQHTDNIPLHALELWKTYELSCLKNIILTKVAEIPKHYNVNSNFKEQLISNLTKVQKNLTQNDKIPN